MALKQPDIKALARRMAMMNIEPEQLEKQLVQPSLGLGDLSAPTAQAPGVQVAANEPWIHGDNWRVGPFTPDEQSRAAADQKWKEMQSEKKGQAQTPMAPPNTAATQASRANPSGIPAAPQSLGTLMQPKPLSGQMPPPPTPIPAPGLQTPPPDLAPPGMPAPLMPMPSPAPLLNAPGPVNDGERAALAEGTQSQKQIMDEFEQSLRAGSPEQGIKGLTNPFAIAAMMSTATHESAFAPANVYGTWSDPSESGKQGRSGGAMSWREERYDNMKAFTQKFGGDTPRNQALFALTEDPSLINKLENSRDPAEAQQYMNQAWKFAGYDKAEGEAADRIATAQRLYRTSPRMFDQQPVAQQAPLPDSVPQMDTANALNPNMMGDGRFTMSDVTSNQAAPTTVPVPADPPVADTAAPTAEAEDPWAAKAGQLAKIGQVLNAMKPPAQKPPTGTAPAPSQGAFNRDPNALKAIMAMLGGQGGGMPTLGMLMNGGGR